MRQALFLAVQADHLEHLGHGLPDLVRGSLPITCRAKATFSKTVLFGSSRKSWNTVPISRRRRGTLRAGQVGEVLAGDEDLPAGGPVLAQHQPQERRLARAGRADEEDELAPLDLQGDVPQGGAARPWVDLGDVLEADHAATGLRLGDGRNREGYVGRTQRCANERTTPSPGLGNRAQPRVSLAAAASAEGPMAVRAADAGRVSRHLGGPRSGRQQGQSSRSALRSSGCRPR